MKKVLQITNYMYPHIGGIEQVTRDIANSLRDDYEQRIICFNHERGNKVDMIDGVSVTRVKCQAKVASQSIALSYGKELKKIMKIFQPDIVIFHYPNPFVAHFLKKYLKKKKFKFILYWHLDITKQKIIGKFFNGQNKFLLRCADKIVATSPNYIEGSPWLLPNREKCIVIPCCVNENRLKYDNSHIEKSKKIREKYEGKTICFAFGRHVEYKGLSYLINASKLLDDSFVVLIAGKGPLTNDLVKEAKNDKKIEFLGKVTDDELKTYLLACDIFCFPSITKNEAFGIGLAEAMYYGKGAITFTIPGSGVNYVSINNETGIEVENGNIVDYAKAMMSFNNIKYGTNAKNRVRELFLESQFKTRIRTLLEVI